MSWPGIIKQKEQLPAMTLDSSPLVNTHPPPQSTNERIASSKREEARIFFHYNVDCVLVEVNVFTENECYPAACMISSYYLVAAGFINIHFLKEKV